MKKLFCVSILVLSFFSFVSGQNITIRRSSQSNECTMGYLYVNGNFIGYSLEREGKMIPAGSYSAYIRTDGSRGWRIELFGVPNRSNIQIHIGNYPWQTTGCTLVGTSANASNCTVSGSTDAMGKLEEAIADIKPDLDLGSNSTQQYSITVIYE